MIFLLIIVIVALIIGGYFLFASLFSLWKNNRQEEWEEALKYDVIRIDVPRNNEKAPLAAEQMFASLHGIYSESALYQYQVSFEVVARDKYIQFYVHMPVHLRDFVEGQIYAQYPTVEIKEVSDYTTEFTENPGKSYAGSELLMTKPDVYPIKLFSDFEVDPISGITSVMSKLNLGEQVWLQIIVRPMGDEWQEKGNSLISQIRSGKKIGGVGVWGVISNGLSKFMKLFVQQALRPGAEETKEEEKKVELPGTVEDALKAIELKIMKLGFETKIRILAISSDPMSAKIKAQNIAAAFKQYNTTNLNGFKPGELAINDKNFLNDYNLRAFEGDGNILNIGELASIFHFPHQSVATPNIVWSGSKKGEPPANLPILESFEKEELTVIGETTFRNTHHLFGIKEDDRRRHMYLIGKSGVGKSVLMENMAIHDILAGKGVIVVDPHGEFAEKVLACIPDERVDDVIVFDPADRAFPIAFNLLEHVDDDFKGMVASGFVGIFKKIFGNSWGPRLEHILRNTVLALLDYPNSTMLDIPRMLTETRFREKVVAEVKDSVIREFWVMEFAQYDSKFRTEAVSPILNKVGQFLATATIRNIVGQPQSRLDIREFMDQQKIMVVNLSRGKIGEDNSALLGAMMITKIQLAAMSRADVTVDKRADSYLYVDEFQNFATESFAVILSEARKYHLNLIIANQYIAQMPEEVRDAVFGNAGSIISFRVGGTDADFLVKEFEPVFENNDLVNLDKYNIYIKLLIDGVSSPAFSAVTLPPVDKLSGNAEKVIDLSRKKHGRPRAEVEEMINSRSKQEEEQAKKEAEAFKTGGLEAVLMMDKDKYKKPAPKPVVIEPKNEEKREPEKEEKAVPKPEGDIKAQAEEKKEDKVIKPALAIDAEIPAENVIEKEKVAGDSDEKKPADVEEETTFKEAPSAGGAESPADSVGEEEMKPPKEKPFRYQNIIGERVYKEQTARGGIKWYVGEDINVPELKEDGYIIDEKGEKMIELGKKVGSTILKKNKE